MSSRIKISLDISSYLNDRLEEIKKKTMRSKSDTIRDILMKHFEEKESK